MWNFAIHEVQNSRNHLPRRNLLCLRNHFSRKHFSGIQIFHSHYSFLNGTMHCSEWLSHQGKREDNEQCINTTAHESNKCCVEHAMFEVPERCLVESWSFWNRTNWRWEYDCDGYIKLCGVVCLPILNMQRVYSTKKSDRNSSWKPLGAQKRQGTYDSMLYPESKYKVD